MTTQLGYDDAYDRDANLGDALIDGEDPEDLLIETDFGVHLLPSSNELEKRRDEAEGRTVRRREASTERRRPAHSKRIRLRDN